MQLQEPTEAQEQETLFRWAQLMCHVRPELKLLYHIPNEGKRSKTAGGALKRCGLKPGVPDICLPVPRGRFHGLYIEMKRQHSGKPTEEQLRWIRDLRNNGYAAVVCNGWQEAKQVIEEYLKNWKENPHDSH